jgi:uncharacterized protein YjlB
LGTQRDDRPKGVQILRRAASVDYQDDHRETAKLSGKQRENLGGKERDPLQHLVGDGDAVVVPAGTFHNVINASQTEQVKLYTVYSPPNHPPGTVHKTKAEADAAEAAEHH